MNGAYFVIFSSGKISSQKRHVCLGTLSPPWSVKKFSKLYIEVDLCKLQRSVTCAMLSIIRTVTGQVARKSSRPKSVSGQFTTIKIATTKLATTESQIAIGGDVTQALCLAA